MILTGRPVHADEALAIGLANRVVRAERRVARPKRSPRDLCRFPQICMRADRRSAYEQWGQPLDVALHGEWQIGLEAIRAGETLAGASRFAAGHGRSGRFDDL
jgi:enoyl-CoA hydratase